MVGVESIEESLSTVDHPLDCIYTDDKGKCFNRALTFASHCWEHLPDQILWSRSFLDKIDSKFDFSKAILEGIYMPLLHLKKMKLQGAWLNCAKLPRARLDSAQLQGASLEYTQLQGANLTGAQLQKANLDNAQLQGADLSNARLHEARFVNAQFQGANLTYAELQGAYLGGANFFDCNLFGLELNGDVIVEEGTEKIAIFKSAYGLSRENFRRFCVVNPSQITQIKSYLPRYCRLNERISSDAVDGYRRLKLFFSAQGQSSDASWAAFKELKMQRRETKGLAKFPMLLMEFLCGYGERPSMVIGWGLAVIIAFALLFGLFHMIHPTQPGSHEILGPLDCLYSSIVTFTTLGFGEITPRPEFRLWVSLEALLGAILMSLFVVTITRRYGARG